MENRILICDDEEGMRRYLEKMLRSWGYQAEACASPRLLLRQLEESESAAELLLLGGKAKVHARILRPVPRTIYQHRVRRRRAGAPVAR